MSKKFTNAEKEKVVAEYSGGQSVASLCGQYDIPRSTLYFWINQYYQLRTSTDTIVYYHEYVELKRHTDKLEVQLEIIKLTGCGTAAPLQEKLAALEKLYGQYSVHALCDALDVSRGTFYNHIFRRKDVTVYDKRREEMREQIKTIFEESRQRFGAKKICAVLSEREIKTSPKYVGELMREMELYSANIDSKREYKKRIRLSKKQNVLQRQFNVSNPNFVWVSDVTCFKVKNLYFYVCVIIDLFSRKVIAHGISTKNSTYLITSTFRQAFESRNHPKGLTFHSDRGAQYTANAFRKLLRLNKVVQSFSNSGSPHDNAVMEAFFSSMKKEELYRNNYKSEKEFRESVDNYIQFYNAERPHSTLAYKTPDRFESFYGKQKHEAV